MHSALPGGRGARRSARRAAVLAPATSLKFVPSPLRCHWYASAVPVAVTENAPFCPATSDKSSGCNAIDGTTPVTVTVRLTVELVSTLAAFVVLVTTTR